MVGEEREKGEKKTECALKLEGEFEGERGNEKGEWESE